ncbi:hypothetical protein [Gordonia sp. SND2]|uniref:hypothetical protein n=1 Tax=Gordonia sp. SND2 TaxID=3388659 RepID=UPI00398A891C
MAAAKPTDDKPVDDKANEQSTVAAPAADTAPKDSTPDSGLVRWKDDDGNVHTGSRYGSAYREHLRNKKD